MRALVPPGDVFGALQPAFRINRRHATAPGCGDGLAVPVVHKVAGREHPVDAGRRGPSTCEDVPLIVDLELTSQDVAARDMTDRNEQAGDIQLPLLTGADVLKHYAFELVGPEQPGHDAVPGKADLGVRSGRAPA